MHLYCKMNFKRQLSIRYLINTIFFNWNVAAGAWLRCRFDCFSRCLFSSSLHGCTFIHYVSLQRERKTTHGHNAERLHWDTVSIYTEVVTIYLWETDRSDCKARQAGLCERRRIFASKYKFTFSQYARQVYWVRRWAALPGLGCGMAGAAGAAGACAIPGALSTPSRSIGCPLPTAPCPASQAWPWQEGTAGTNLCCKWTDG